MTTGCGGSPLGRGLRGAVGQKGGLRSLPARVLGEPGRWEEDLPVEFHRW